LLKADGKLVAKLKELFSELKANGKLDAAKHLDLLKIKCFSRDTLVHTATGPRPIGEIEPGEQIWSYHFERGVWGLCEVKKRLAPLVPMAPAWERPASRLRLLLSGRNVQ